MATVLEILRRGRERIGDPARWCKGIAACDAKGHGTGACHPAAVRWCSSGCSLRECIDALGISETAAKPEYVILHGKVVDFLNRTTREMFPSCSGIIEYQDGANRTHAEVMAVWDRAIAKAQEMEEKR